MKKVAIVTKYSAYNFGAMLQAYALQQVIRSTGSACYIVDYDRKNRPGKLPWSCLSGLVNNLYHVLYHNQLDLGYSRFEKFIEEKYNKTIQYAGATDLQKNPPDMDVFITGSDQVWNPLKIDETYFLRFAPKRAIKASYAASMGISYMPEGGRQLFQEYVKEMDYISVRETDAQELVQKTVNRKAEVHVDPVLLISTEEWKQIAISPKRSKPYILCYVLYRPEWLNDWLRMLHKATGLEIVAVTSSAYRNIYHNRMVRDAGPCEMLGLIKDAEFVISSSFHGAALSIALKKPFYAVVNPDAPARLTNLLQTFGLEDRIITQKSPTVMAPIDYAPVAEKQVAERDRSIAYLSQIIEQGHKYESINENHDILHGDISQVGDKCTGCKACMEICPTKAIRFIRDAEGFEYPSIDQNKCIHCGKCIRKCHAVNHISNTKDSCEAYFGWCRDEEVRRLSTSGGIFSLFSQWVLKRDGLVIGAYFEEKTKRILHASSDDVPFEVFRRSKYVESDLDQTYTWIHNGLAQGRYVLFCGTPCQCSGVRRVFGNHEKLILCDFFCHGVPSSKVFQEFLEYKEQHANDTVLDYQFRTKYFGWSQYGVDITYQNKRKQTHTVGRCEWFYKASMLDNMFLRKSCYTCDKAVYHEADITIGDFWGITSYKPELNDNKGISLIVCNNAKGRQMLSEVEDDAVLFDLEKRYLEYAFRVKTSDKLISKRNQVFDEYSRIGCANFIKRYYSKRLMLTKLVFQIKKKKFIQE